MRRFPFAWSLLVLVACSSTGSSDGSGGTGNPADCVEPIGQAMSQPCCLAHGVDACGANLFCAAFDGRTQPTCYPERSRLDNTECDADIDCVSNSCHPAERKCRAMPWTTCTAAVGCAPGTSGERYLCADGDHGLACQPIGDGSYGAVCEGDADCVGTVCRDGQCTFDLACRLPGDGSGPCIEAPDSGSCQTCLTNAVYACISACPTDGAEFAQCTNSSGCSDATCLMETCGDQFCDFFTCAGQTCDTAIDCF
jgi:hypothetical protein